VHVFVQLRIPKHHSRFNFDLATARRHFFLQKTAKKVFKDELAHEMNRDRGKNFRRDRHFFSFRRATTHPTQSRAPEKVTVPHHRRKI
jgi:hypothetical protein